MSKAIFKEEDYLAANPDVAAAVRDGGFHSGHEHCLKYGKSEGRPLSFLGGGFPRGESSSLSGQERTGSGNRSQPQSRRPQKEWL